MHYLIAFIFLVLAGIHFYWAAGGRWGYEYVIPEIPGGAQKFTPGPFLTALVGIGLLGLAIFYIQHYGTLSLPVPEVIMDTGKWIIPSLFLMRAIGDFNVAGLFKKIKKTKFGKADTRYFTPLCLFIASLGYVIATI